MHIKLKNEILYWYHTHNEGQFSHHSVLSVWDFIVNKYGDNTLKKPVAMCRNEYLRLHPEVDMSKAGRTVGNYKQKI